MVKVKVNKELFEALQRIERRGEECLELLVMGVMRGENYKAEENLIFNNIEREKMLKIYKYGYELLDTPEEKLLFKWEESKSLPINLCLFYREGILDTLNDLGIKIKGINS